MRSAPSPPSHTAHPLSYTHQVRPFSSIPSAQACSLRPSPSPLPDTPGRRLGSSCPPVAMVTRSVPGAAWRAGAGQPRNARTGGLPGDQGSLCPAVVELCDLAGMEAPGARLGPPVSRDRVIADFPKALRPPVFQWYTPEACLQLKDHFHGQVRAACRERRTGTVGLKVSKVVVLGDLYVGKTSLINRFCKDVFDRHYKATIGVDFEIERFEIAGVPYSLQIWDTAGQEKFKCIASAYYRGAQVIITAFDLADIKTLGHTSSVCPPCPRQWLADAQRENEPGSSSVFLVGTKKDLLSGPACERTEMDAVQLANEMQAEYWSVSAKTGENVKAFFTRVAALAFEQSVLQELERRGSRRAQIGAGASISIDCSPECLDSFTTPPTMHQCPSFPTAPPTFIVICSCHLSQSDRCVVVSQSCLNLHFSDQ
ncbi:ras-related protein Rab-36 isoform X4 [Sminthopsis crassicaudata]|uniref:ras-related protein Rab-36 isoform X4 n=1 Tax=Sminthopsis crassicaudata TaxID=9301 RepID=UPI003D69FA69